MARLQHSFLALQHDNTCLRTAANDHSALLSTLREQLAEKTGRVLELEECLADQERQLATLNHRTKVSHTLCYIWLPCPPHSTHCTLHCTVPPKQAQRAGGVPGGGGGSKGGPQRLPEAEPGEVQ